MLPIQSLLQRIRWDPAFGDADFTIGYYDRAQHAIVTVPFERIRLEPGSRFSFSSVEADGTVHEVPLHRVREVRRNGEPIWQRRVSADSRPAHRH